VNETKHKIRPNHPRAYFSEFFEISLFSIITYVASITFLIKGLLLVYIYNLEICASNIKPINCAGYARPFTFTKVGQRLKPRYARNSSYLDV
jgi:hypothetical protein